VSPSDQPDRAEGCIVPFVFSNQTGWIGFFIINEPHRGKGWGKDLFAAALQRFKDTGTRFVGLDAVQEQVNTYARRGFVSKGLVRLMQRGSVSKSPLSVQEDGDVDGKIVQLSDVNSDALVKSDLEHTGLERTRLWTKEALFSRPDAWGFALQTSDDELLGWILVRSCQHGLRLGPLYSTSSKVASKLLHMAMENCKDKPGSLIAEIWMGNESAHSVFSGAGWEDVGVDYHRMWLDGKVPPEQDKGGVAETRVFAMFDAGQG